MATFAPGNKLDNECLHYRQVILVKSRGELVTSCSGATISHIDRKLKVSRLDIVRNGQAACGMSYCSIHTSNEYNDDHDNE